MSPYQAWPFLSDPAHPFLSAVWAVAIHGVVCLLVVAPIVWRSQYRVIWGAVAAVGGSLIDLDHFVAAGSLSLHAIETLGDRPATHSILFVLLVAVATFALTRRALLAWSLFAVWTAHLLFDAAGGHERFFYPFGDSNGLPWLACPLGTLALLAASAVIARVGARRGFAAAGRPVALVAD